MKVRGFTLIEVVLALSIVAALLVVMFGGLRIGLAAWQRGDARAEALQHERSLTQLLRRALSGVHPYRGTIPGPDTVGLVFEGAPDRMAFVTGTPPIPFATPIAFAAVSVSQDESGLVMREKPLPDPEPFERLAPVANDSTVAELRLRYLRPGRDGQPEGRTWEDRWDGAQEQTLPSAIEIRLTTAQGIQRADQIVLVVGLRAIAP